MFINHTILFRQDFHFGTAICVLLTQQQLKLAFNYSSPDVCSPCYNSLMPDLGQNWVIIGSGNGLLPDREWAIT